MELHEASLRDGSSSRAESRIARNHQPARVRVLNSFPDSAARIDRSRRLDAEAAFDRLTIAARSVCSSRARCNASKQFGVVELAGLRIVKTP